MSKEEIARPAPVFNQDASPLTQEQLLEAMSPEGRIRWASVMHRGHLAMTASFGIQSAVLLHMATTIVPDIKIIFLDTQHLHPETYKYKDELVERLDLKLYTYQAGLSAEEQHKLYAPMWENGLANDDYKYRNKVEPMNRAKAELDITCWLSGLRRQQSERRASVPIIEQDGFVQKLYPIIDLTEAQIIDYMHKHDLPFHPLSYENYRTIGDFFENPVVRAECGLHVPIGPFDPAI